MCVETLLFFCGFLLVVVPFYKCKALFWGGVSLCFCGVMFLPHCRWPLLLVALLTVMYII